MSRSARTPVIAQIFTWRAVDKLGLPAIAARLNADPVTYPPPNPAALTGWTAQNIAAMIRNPKYTGYMVYGRHRTRNGRRVPVPQDQWLWSPAPVHPAIIDRDTWDLAQTVSAGHGSSRDGEDLNTHPATLRFYPYRGRVRCRDCDRRMTGVTKHAAYQLTYYRCPHDWASPKHAATHPDHPRTVQAPELRLDEVVGRFFATRIFGPERAALMAAQLPATDAAAAADRDAQVTMIQARISRIESAQNSQILELEELPANPADTATAALRARIRARFAELHEERERLEAQLKALAKIVPVAADLTLLDRLPLAGDVLPDLPPRLKARLFQAFDIAVLWNKPGGQATVRAEITETTLHAVPGILDPSQDGYDDTGTSQPAPMGHLANTPRSGRGVPPPHNRASERTARIPHNGQRGRGGGRAAVPDHWITG
jgi:site-specific DNA recombinase